MTTTPTLYFRGTDDEIELVRQLQQNGVPGTTCGRGGRRLAPVFAGDVEACDSVVLLPNVTDYDAKRITRAYHPVPVYRLKDLLAGQPVTPPPEPTPEPVAPAPPAAPPLVPVVAKAALSNAQLRRLHTRQLRDLASGRGIVTSAAQDRASLIAAIEADAQKGPPP